MINAYEIFQQLHDDFATEILGFFRREQRDIYKTTVTTLAVQKKLRPVFVQKKPGPAQIAWLIKTLKQRSSDTVAEHLLQVWLLKTQRDLLVTFVGALGIEHDEEGGVDDLPETIDDEKLKEGIDLLLAKNPAPLVTLYLAVFQLQQPGGWPEIEAALTSDERLKLGDPLEVAAVAEVSEPDA